MIEICDFVYNNYPKLKTQVPRWKLLSLLDRNGDKIIYVKEDNQLRGVGMFVRLSDATLEDLELFSQYATLEEIKQVLSDPEFVNGLLKEGGENIHFLYVLADRTKTILEGLREVIKRESPKTISWFSPDMKRFNKFTIKNRRKLWLHC